MTATTGAERVEDPEEVDASDVTGAGASEESTRRYVRSPEDLLRLVVFALIAALFVNLDLWVEDGVLGLEEDVIELVSFLPPAVVRVMQGAAEIIAAIVALCVYAVPLVTKRYRLFGYIVVASLVSSLLMTGLIEVIDRNTSTVMDNRLAVRSGVTAATTAGAIGLAQLTAQLTVVGPFVGRRWRRAGAAVLAVVTVMSLLSSVRLPLGLLAALPVGAAIGTGVLLAFGRPDRRPTVHAVRAALREAGLPVAEVRPASVDARGSTPYFATLDDGAGLFVKVLGSQERAADLMFRVYRFLRLKDVGDDRPFSSLRRTVEHEALLALLARNVDIRTPRLRGVVNVGADSMLLAYELIDGRSLDRLDDGDVTDDLMRSVWQQIALLRANRVAHRDLRRANVFVDDDGEAWLIDFGFSEAAVPDEILDADVAQMLASFAVVTGPGRAVATAVDVLGTEVVGASLARLQLKAFSGATQSSLKEQKGLLDELRDEVIAQCGVTEIEYARIERVNRRTVVVIALLGAATYFLFPQFADLPGIIDQVQDANWGWTPLLVVGSAATYVAASVSLAGAVPPRVPAGPMFMAAVGSSFASKLAPAGLGGMALNVRFLQKQGIDEPVAVSGIGLNTIAGFVGHVSLVGVFLVWAGPDAFESFSLPDPSKFVLGGGIAVAIVVVGLLIPAVRRLVIERLVPPLRRAFEGTSQVLRRPGKVAMLVGGSALVTLSYIVTLYIATLAFGGDLPFATVGAVYLVGAAIAQAAPTPGGLGAVEAAFIGGLVAAGMDNTVAVPAVFLYRLFTFWVPILPGWLAFNWLQRNDYL